MNYITPALCPENEKDASVPTGKEGNETRLRKRNRLRRKSSRASELECKDRVEESVSTKKSSSLVVSEVSASTRKNGSLTVSVAPISSKKSGSLAVSEAPISSKKSGSLAVSEASVSSKKSGPPAVSTVASKNTTKKEASVSSDEALNLIQPALCSENEKDASVPTGKEGSETRLRKRKRSRRESSGASELENKKDRASSSHPSSRTPLDDAKVTNGKERTFNSLKVVAIGTDMKKKVRNDPLRMLLMQPVKRAPPPKKREILRNGDIPIVVHMGVMPRPVIVQIDDNDDDSSSHRDAEPDVVEVKGSDRKREKRKRSSPRSPLDLTKSSSSLDSETRDADLVVKTVGARRPNVGKKAAAAAITASGGDPVSSPVEVRGSTHSLSIPVSPVGVIDSPRSLSKPSSSQPCTRPSDDPRSSNTVDAGISLTIFRLGIFGICTTQVFFL